jgi:type VI secretion system protein ImpH
MAATVGRTDPPLKRGRKGPALADILLDEAYRFDFFQAVRLLERMSPGRMPVGRHADPAREVARFRTRVSIEFPPSEIYQITHDTSAEAGAPPSVTVAFMGLTGPLGVLPHPYTELLIERTRYKDTALWEFLDLFNHRMISLFYRAWEKYRFPIAYERGEEDKFTRALFGVIGLGMGGLRDRTSVLDECLLFYGGLAAQRPHSASALEAILADYFGVPARAEQFFGQWLTLDDESVSRLGAANSRLGLSTIVGSRVWDGQSKFRMKLGPLGLEDFNAFLPRGAAFSMATDLVRFLVGGELDFDLQLILKAEEVPACTLATAGKTGSMLGWTSWLKTREFARDDSQVVLSPEAKRAS